MSVGECEEKTIKLHKRCGRSLWIARYMIPKKKDPDKRGALEG